MEKRVNININTSLTNSPKKINKPLKKVDLGAAANFGRDTSQSPMPHGDNDLLNDDFNPRASEAQEDRKSTTEFGDFETAFENDTSAAHKHDDGFADFSSAFSQNVAQNNQQFSALPNLLGTTPNVVPNVIPPPNMTSNVPNLFMGAPNLVGGTQPNIAGNNLVEGVPPVTNIMGGGPPQNQNLLGNNFINTPKLPVQQPQKSNSNDLLGDLADFGNLSIQPQSPVTTPANNNLGLLGSSNNDLLDGLGSGKFERILILPYNSNNSHQYSLFWCK